MTTFSATSQIERIIMPTLMRIPLLKFYVKTRGWQFVLAWAHRLSGIILVAYIWFHIYTLSFLQTPDVFETKMKLFGFGLFIMLEWALAIPVIYHALNGGRLLLYELFGNRKDISAIRWVFNLSAVYVLLIGFMMILGDQTVSAVFFWLCALVSSISLCYLVVSKIQRTQNTFGWKLQRVSGGFLVIMIPAHFLFMHLNPSVGHDTGMILNRMQSFFIKAIDILLVMGTLYHGGYGVLSIAKDYISSRAAIFVFILLLFLIMAPFAWIGINLVFTV